jgi:hypothetical protein
MSSRNWFFGVFLALLTGLALFSACGEDGPVGPCYTVDELFGSESSVSDSTSAREAFELYLARLEESGGYPVFGFSHLSYVRSAGSETYGGQMFWGIVALGVEDAESTETEAFRVRQDGVVVLMLGCI